MFQLFETIWKTKNSALCLTQKQRNSYISHMCHIWHILHGHMWGCMDICAKYITFIIHVTRSTIHIICKLQFIFLAYITQHVWLSDCKYRSHYLRSILSYRSSSEVYMCQNVTSYNILLYVTAIHVLETNIPAKLHKHATYLTGTYGYICTYKCHIWSLWIQPSDQKHHQWCWCQFLIP